MKIKTLNVHEQAMWNALEEMRLARRRRIMNRLAAVIPAVFMAGWLVVLCAAVFN